MEFNIKEICFASPVVEEASTPRPWLEKRRTLLQHYNGCVSRDCGTESKLFTSQQWRPGMPQRLHSERHRVTRAPHPLTNNRKVDHSPAPRQWCPHQRRQRRRGCRSFGTDGRRFEITVTIKPHSFNINISFLGFLPLWSCKLQTESYHKLSRAPRSTGGALLHIRFVYSVYSTTDNSCYC